MASKYVIGNTQNEFLINGILIPKRKYSDIERQNGKIQYTEVSESELYELNKNPTFKNLVEIGYVKVLDKLPAYALTSEEKATTYKRQLSTAETNLKKKEAEIEALKAKIEALTGSTEEVLGETETESDSESATTTSKRKRKSSKTTETSETTEE